MKTSSTPTSGSWLYNTLRTLASHYGHTAVDHTHLFASAPVNASPESAQACCEMSPNAEAACACCC